MKKVNDGQGVSRLNQIFLMPPKVLSGIGAIGQLKEHIGGKGTKALLVTDAMMVQIGNSQKVTTVLEEAGIDYCLYAEVNSEPTDEMVKKGVQLFSSEQCDFIIALGGGSPIDAAKAIGFMSVNGGEISSYLKKVITTPIPYLVAVPTTAGTGSEATQFTIITDTQKDVKMLLRGPALMPQLAVVDPAFSLTTPPKVTVATGIDALTHAIEAYSSRQAQPLSDVFALSAVKRIYHNLKVVYKDGGNVEARYQMSLAALEAGIAFNNSSVTLVHGLSRPIGALFHVPHGLSNAILLTKCLEFAVPGNMRRFAEIAKTINLCSPDAKAEEAAGRLIEAVADFCRDLGVPSVQELKIDKEEFYKNLNKMAEDALDSGSPANTFRIPTKEQIMEIYKQLW